MQPIQPPRWTDALRVLDTPSVRAALERLRLSAQVFEAFVDRTLAAHDRMTVAAGSAASEAEDRPHGSEAHAPEAADDLKSRAVCSKIVPPAQENLPQQEMDKIYRVVRSTDRNTPFNFNPGIDAYSAVVSVLVSTGQGVKFANSVATGICFEGREPNSAFANADRTDYVRPPPIPQNRKCAVPRRRDGAPYRCVYVAAYDNRLTISTAAVTVIWRCGE